MPRDRLDDRRRLLSQLDALKRGVDNQAEWQGLDKLRQQAFDAILGGVGSAFDWTKEDPRTIERYDTKSLVRPGVDQQTVEQPQELCRSRRLARQTDAAGAPLV